MNKSTLLEVIVLGSGTSQGIPVIGCECDVCKSSNPRHRRTRSSVYLKYSGKKILIDIGPDFRQQMIREQLNDVDFVLITHEHQDHVAGLDDIRAINFKWRKNIPFYASPWVVDDLEKRFAYAFAKNPYPGVPRVELNPFENKAFIIEDVEILPILVYHGKMPVFGFRFDNFAYVTDAKTISKQEQNKLQDLDVLIINALRIHEHHAHFNLEEALNFIETIRPKKTYLTHISHLMGNPEKIKEKLPQNVYLAYDGLKLNV